MIGKAKTFSVKRQAKSKGGNQFSLQICAHQCD